MRVELLVTLKGAETLWKKGTIFNDAVVPFPKDIQDEVRARAKTVRILPDIDPDQSIQFHVDEDDQDDIGEMPATETPDIVAGETEDESEIEIDENPTEFFPELEGLLEMHGNNFKDVAALLNATPMVVGRWRKKMPKPDIVDRIKRVYERLVTDDQGGVDDPASAGT